MTVRAFAELQPSPRESEIFDESWYGLTYPAARVDVAAERANNLRDHYERLGRHRGYLPNPTAIRPNNPATHRSAFGGLWVDLNNALDILEGKRQLGMIDERQYGLLSAFIRDGYVIIPGCVPDSILEPALQALENAYNGGDPGQNFLTDAVPEGFSAWRPELRDHPTKANEIHTRSAAIRNASLVPAITEFLGLIFERPALLSQTLGFYRGSAQAVHQDSAYVAYTLSTQFAASWIAFEDVSHNSGELCYYPGSQKFSDYMFFDRYKGTWEAGRHGHACDVPAYEATLPEQAAARGIELETFLAKKGDVLIWAADLAHGGRPISRERSRKSLVSHYCPAEVAPGYFEDKPGREVRRHPSGHYYSTWLEFPETEGEQPSSEHPLQPESTPPQAGSRPATGKLDRLLRRLKG